ncbi:CocE/NonD family hydrolase [Kribbella sp. NPDC050124]|uniref:CocE/NonD family hydrolase n=1 Tax=Kribbella sp. NPDC050124 TaxID=3364114 RepID=UPI0037A38FBB
MHRMVSTYVPRGYAVAFVDMPGTFRSTGCSDVGADLEVLGTKAVIDWLNNRVPGYNADYVSNDASPRCVELTDEIEQDSDTRTGSYSRWWDPRNYNLDARNVHASVYVVHGLGDENVKTRHFGEWWDQLQRYDVPRWPAVGARQTTLKLSKAADAKTGGLSIAAASSDPVSFTGTDDPSVDTVVLDPTTARPDRAVFLSDELEKAVRVTGTGKVTVRVKSNKIATGIKARLVDYGTANRYTNVTNVPNTSVYWGDGNALDTGCYA